MCRYDPQQGYIPGGIQETVKPLPDDNFAFSSFDNNVFVAYSFFIDPDNADETFAPLPLVA